MATTNPTIGPISALICTLAEVKDAPEVSLYLGLGLSLDRWQSLKAELIRSGMITEQHNVINLTPAGYNLALRFEAAMAVAAKIKPNPTKVA